MQSSDPGHLFQSNQQLQDDAKRSRKRKAAERLGDPMTVGKVIDFVVHGPTLYSAESGWLARQVDIASSKTTRLYKGHQGPVTCVALMQTPGRVLLLTGSWDKTIRVWDANTGDLLKILLAHTDFLKSLLILPGGYLLSTSSDRSIKLWEIISAGDSVDARCVQTIREHTRPVDKSTSSIENDRTMVWTADSMGTIKQWTFADGQLQAVRDLPGHETSVTDLVHTEDGLWSVSMDRNAILHADTHTTLKHTTSLHSILPIPSEMTPRSLIVTGGEDEDLIVWEDRGEGFAPISRLEAHSHVVSTIRIWQVEGRAGLILSGSLDGTIRRWTLQDLLHPPALSYEEDAVETTMTAEEERELLELMDEE